MEHTHVLTVNELTRRLRLWKPTAYDLLHSGESAAVRCGKVGRIPEEAVESLLRGGANEQRTTEKPRPPASQSEKPACCPVLRQEPRMMGRLRVTAEATIAPSRLSGRRACFLCQPCVRRNAQAGAWAAGRLPHRRWRGWTQNRESPGVAARALLTGADGDSARKTVSKHG